MGFLRRLFGSARGFGHRRMARRRPADDQFNAGATTVRPGQGRHARGGLRGLFGGRRGRRF